MENRTLTTTLRPDWQAALRNAARVAFAAEIRNALYWKIIEEAKNIGRMNKVSDPIGCFVAGTLVHTKEGLKPIEQIKVGDLVLSKPESGEGEQAYKRVVKTFSFDDKDVYRVTWITKEALNAANLSDDLSLHQSDIQYLVATGNHPFWVKGLGWTRLDRLEYGNELELGDGRTGIFGSADPIYRTTSEGVGWVLAPSIEPDDGWLIDLRDGQIIPGHELVYNDDVDWEHGDERLKLTVYNIKVEDCHTYFVGEMGVWVHHD